MSFQFPANIRESLVHEVLIEGARLNPDYPFAFTLDGDVRDAPIETASYRRLISDASHVASCLQASIPKRLPGSAPIYIGLLGRSSYSYAVHLTACMTSGWIPTLISTKNSREAVKHLLSVSKSSYFIVEKELVSYGQSLHLSIPIVQFEDISKFEVDVNECRSDVMSDEQRAVERELPSMYLHTSGSTGHPKIIALTHKVLTGWMDSNTKENTDFCFRPLFPQSPLYHGYGMFIIMAWTPCGGSPSFIVRSIKPFTGESVLAYTKKLHNYLQTQPLEEIGLSKEVVLATIPSVLVEVYSAGDETIAEFARYTKGVLVGGARLPRNVGDALCERGVNITNAYGATEVGMPFNHHLPLKPQTNGEWLYLPLKKTYKHHWIPTDDPERNRLVVSPYIDSPAILNYEDPIGYDTSDIWIEHPTKKGWYRHDGRAGDVTVLSNGEKTDNKQIESFLLTNNRRKIAHVIVFGSGRPQNGILISPAEPTMNDKEFFNEIWPTIEEMNKIIPSHSRVVKELVIIEDAQSPFALTDKGTVREKITLNLYEEKIEKAYEEMESRQRSSDVPLPETFGREEISSFLRRSLLSLLPDINISDKDDLFEHGMDSLLAVRLRSTIIQLIYAAEGVSQTPTVPKNVVYDRPSIDALTEYIVSFLTTSTNGVANEPGVSTRIRECTKRFTSNFAKRVISADQSKYDDGLEYIVVTGTTGSLGSFVLNLLLDRPSVRRVSCFNRRTEVETMKRQLSGFKERGLNSKRLEAALGVRVMLYDVDLSDSKLGLEEAVYDEIRTSVTHIIHIAWLLNFNLKMEGFERVHIAGVRNLIDLAISSPRKSSPHFVFCSSIATVANYKGGDVPEEPVVDEEETMGGYGHAKLVGERITETASKEIGLNSSVVRIGQIAGSSESGMWTRTEFQPILIRSCFAIGAVPVDLPDIRWLPVNVTASVVSKLTFNPQVTEGNTGYFHLENPVSSPWSVVAKMISQYRGANLPLVSFAQWLDKVREYGVEDAEKVPAVRLLSFFENFGLMPALGVKKTAEIAPEVKYGSVSSELLTKYLDYQSK